MHLALTSLMLTVAIQSATDALKARDAEIRGALPPADREMTAAERKHLGDLLTQAVDLPGMAQASLGKRWAGLSEADRKRYLGAFSSFFKKASEGEIDFYRSSEITYSPEQAAEDGEVKVPTSITIKGEPTPVVYTVRKEASGYKILDLTIDDVSTVENYRSSFGRVLDKEGMDGLVKRLEKTPKPVGK